MLLGCIADDFTGASDLANTLSKGGMATVQFVGIPRATAPSNCEAGVVALKTRSVAPEEAVAQSLEALAWLRSQGCRQFLFKYCSTFDSTPQGNIGPVAEALLDALQASVAVVCPVFPAAGRTLFMGHLFVGDRLLNESGMEKHPLNPMADADIRRWLRHQCDGEIGFVPHGTVRKGAEHIEAALLREGEAGRRLAVIDAIADEDLIMIGRAVAGHKLITGGSGIALGLPANFRAAGLLASKSSIYKAGTGPGVVLSGSCSRISQAQVASYLDDHPGLAVDADALMAGNQSPTEAIAFVLEHLAEEPIVYSTADSARIEKAQSIHGRQRLADAIEHFFGDVARGLVKGGVKRIAVGGGETSGAIVKALGVDSFSIGPEIDPGVPALATIGKPPVHLALKSGNFGAVEFYAKALRALGTRN